MRLILCQPPVRHPAPRDSTTIATHNMLDSTTNVPFLRRQESVDQYTVNEVSTLRTERIPPKSARMEY